MHWAGWWRSRRLASRRRRWVVGDAARSHVKPELSAELWLVDGGELAVWHHSRRLPEVCRLSPWSHGCHLRVGAILCSFWVPYILHLQKMGRNNFSQNLFLEKRKKKSLGLKTPVFKFKTPGQLYTFPAFSTFLPHFSRRIILTIYITLKILKYRMSEIHWHYISLLKTWLIILTVLLYTAVKCKHISLTDTGSVSFKILMFIRVSILYNY